MVRRGNGNTFCGDMLDEKTGALLAAINGKCGGESYKIIEEKEFSDCLARRGGADRGEIRAMLSFLEAERLIEIRYAEDGLYCVKPLAEGRKYFEQERLRTAERNERRRSDFLLSLLGAFAGAFLGSLLFWAVSLLWA